MNKSKLKSYAPKAREEFIKVVSERAALYGITSTKIEACEVKGDYAFISGKPFPKLIEGSRKGLIQRIDVKGFGPVMEEVAYTWFNRFAAIRFMEVNGYLSHGYRVLSHPEGHPEPEILEKAHYLDGLDGLTKDEIVSLKTAGDKDAELYRKLIIAQCNELHSAMPFLFEKVDDPTELLLPDNLLNTDSITRQMVAAIPEEDWKAVEIIGWLYQFYISEKKDSLMKAKKAYKTEDIPAVTQLFTPNWIVKYLVQNSLGAKWLATYPSSKIKEKMEYYIEPAEQSEEVKKQLKEITPEALNPEELTVMDPACGSGHILVEAYDLLKEIYLERGYRPKDIPALILTNNLFGLEIDERAAQLSGFALLMKARADDSNIFSKQKVQPNIVCIQETAGLDVEGLLRNINVPLTKKTISTAKGELDFMDEIAAPLFAKSADKKDVLTTEERLTVHDLRELLELFENAKTFGSLIRIPEEMIAKLPRIHDRLKAAQASSELMAQRPSDLIVPFLRQAEVMANQYDCVIANPPYMGGKGMNGLLKEFSGSQYPATKSDLFAMFIERGFEMARDDIGINAMITMQSWMFLSSFEKCREFWMRNKTITTMAHLGARAFSTISGEVVTVTAFTFRNKHLGMFRPTFLRLINGGEEDKQQGIIGKRNSFTHTVQDDFKKIPGSPIAYWVSDTVRSVFANNIVLKKIGDTRQGMATSDNDRFLRLWHEVSHSKVCREAVSNDFAESSRAKWFPYNKGGDFRKWYGNMGFYVNWESGGRELLDYASSLYGSATRTIKSMSEYFKPCISWSKISSSHLAMRYYPAGFIFDVAGCCIFSESTEDLHYLLGYSNTNVVRHLLEAISPTLNFEAGHIASLPIIRYKDDQVIRIVEELIATAKNDWDYFETSWDFESFPLLSKHINAEMVAGSFLNWNKHCVENIRKMKELEENNNRIFIEAYSLQDELKSDVSEVEITLGRADKTDDMTRLASYAVGCMMGRYSLDKPGLIYAQSGNEGFDRSQYKKFPADDDGIIPITSREWFDYDAASRFFEFIGVAWDIKELDANLDFIADAIGRKANESSREAIRRYFADSFYKDHCQTYKKRPIYWLFTSGSEKTFQTLVYLHRYNEGTLSRMRTEYVLPLQTKINRQIEHLEKDKDSASSTSAANKIQKEIAELLKQKEELIKFDEQLRHYADMKIRLDLDDGVKVNYGKFGDLLANVKAITGSKEADE